MNIKKLLLGLIAVLSFGTTAMAENYQINTIALQGYDAVSYQTGKRPIKGNGHFTADHKGATYLFSNEKNQTLFTNNPEKYTPAYGGYCAFGVSVGKKFVGDPEVWRLVDGKLYLNLDEGIQDMWLKDVPGKISVANKQWAKIKDKSPASL